MDGCMITGIRDSHFRSRPCLPSLPVLSMSVPLPPPLPDRNSALRTYLRGFALLVPTWCVWIYAHTVLLPKLEHIWEITGLTHSKAQWLIEGSRALMQHTHFVFAGVVLLLVLLEFRWDGWPRYRRAAIASATLFFHTAVLLGVTALCTAVLLAVPLLTKMK